MSFISSFEIIKVVVPESSIFFLLYIYIYIYIFVFQDQQQMLQQLIIMGLRPLLANGLITFFINGNTVFNNGPKSLPRYPPDWIILDNLSFIQLYIS